MANATINLRWRLSQNTEVLQYQFSNNKNCQTLPLGSKTSFFENKSKTMIGAIPSGPMINSPIPMVSDLLTPEISPQHIPFVPPFGYHKNVFYMIGLIWTNWTDVKVPAFLIPTLSGGSCAGLFLFLEKLEENAVAPPPLMEFIHHLSPWHSWIWWIIDVIHICVILRTSNQLAGRDDWMNKSYKEKKKRHLRCMLHSSISVGGWDWVYLYLD